MKVLEAKVVDIQEWTDLGAKLASIAPAKFEALLEALRKIVEFQEELASFDWQLFLRGRPRKHYRA